MAARLASISRIAVEAALDEFEQIGREAFLEKYGFGSARDYLVQHPATGVWADSKAIVGAAHGYQHPEQGPLSASQFSGGQATVVRLLRGLGFDVTAIQRDVDPAHEGAGAGEPWSQTEVELVVADYLQMLTLELAGQKYNKSSRRKALLPLLNGRSEGSIEYKRRNISAVMIFLGFPYLRGYLPAPNAQGLLSEVVEAEIRRSATLDKAATAAVDVPASDPDLETFEATRVPRPARSNLVQEERTPYFHAVKRDYLEREARNRSLGEAGEHFILRYEQWRLVHEGVGQLADQVRHVSALDGDGLGHDILSFDRHGEKRYLEVKTTAFGERTPFFISSTEVAFARTEPNRFSVCRVFDFRAGPRFFELPGPLEQHCILDPATYRAILQ